MNATAAKILKALADTLAYTGGEWASIDALRDEVLGSRADFDAAFLQLTKAFKIHAAPEENQKMITEGNRRNAVRVGGEDKHLARFI